MSTTLSQQEVQAIDFYNQRVRSGDTTDNPLWADDFTFLMFEGHPNGPVVDIGCGIGRAIGVLDNYGIRSYIGIDPSEASIDFCRKTYPEHNFEVSEVRLLGENHPNRFGGFLFMNVLMHTPKSDCVNILKSIRASLLDGAIGLLNFPKPSMADRISEAASALTFSFYLRDEIEEALASAGFEIWNVREDEDLVMVHVVAT